MKTYFLNIADITFQVSTTEELLNLTPEVGYLSFICENSINADINIDVKLGKPDDTDYNLLFDVPDNTSTGKLWTIHGNGNKYFIHSLFQNNEKQEVYACFDDSFNKWTIYINLETSTTISIDPFTYPIGPIIMLYSVLISEGIMIHSSAVNYKDKGYVFSGFSGIGKTTISGIFKDAGAERINDDRLIIRKKDNDYLVYNTPMFYADDKKQMKLDRIFLLAQMPTNRLTPLMGVAAITKFSAFCIQHNFHKTLMELQLKFVVEMCKKIPVAVLGFKPDREVVEFLEENK